MGTRRKTSRTKHRSVEDKTMIKGNMENKYLTVVKN